MDKNGVVTPPIDNRMVAETVRRGIESASAQWTRKFGELQRQVNAHTYAEPARVLVLSDLPLPTPVGGGVCFIIGKGKWYYSNGATWTEVAGGGPGPDPDPDPDPEPGTVVKHNIVDPTWHTVTGPAWNVIGLDAQDHLGVLVTSNDPTGQAILRTNSSGQVGVKRLVTEQIYAHGGLGMSNILLQPSGVGASVIIPQLNRIGTEDARYSPTSMPRRGWSIHHRFEGEVPDMRSELVINRILADELRVRIFVADETRVDRGILIIAKGYGLLSQPFQVPDAPEDWSYIYFEDSPVVDGALFSDNDWVMIQRADFSGGGAKLDWIWGRVTGYYPVPPPVPLPDNYIGEQRWVFTLKSGDVDEPIPAGAFTLGFGAPGQGYIVLDAVSTSFVPQISVHVWGVNANGVPVPGATPYGSNIDGALDMSGHSARVIMGNLDPAVDNVLNPQGWGFYGTNTYLKGILQTANARIDDKGASVFTDSSAGAYQWDIFGFRKKGVTDNPVYSYYQGYWGPTSVHAKLILHDKEGDGTLGGRDANFEIAANAQDTKSAKLTLSANYAEPPLRTALVSMESSPLNPGQLLLWGAESIQLRVLNATGSSATRRISTQGDIVPNTSNAFSLGAADLKWKEIHVGTIRADAIIGEAIGGAEWEFAGSMVIDANASGTTTLTITNQGAGVVDVIMDRDLTIGRTFAAAGAAISGNLVMGGNVAMNPGATVDGTDISAHVANVNAHHNRLHSIVDALDHSAVGLKYDVVGLSDDNVLGMLRPMADVTPAQAAILRTNGSGIVGVQGITTHQIFSRNEVGKLDIELRPVTNGAVVTLFDRDVRSSNFNPFTSPIQGYAIKNRLAGTTPTNMSELYINNILADEFHVKVFVADETRVDRGIEYIAKGYGLLSRAFITPGSIGGTRTVYFENSPVVNGALFSPNDWVMIQLANFATPGGGADLEWIWGQVSNYAEVTKPGGPTGLDPDDPGEQSWTFTLRLGSQNRTIRNGSFALNFGAPGQGYIVLNATFGSIVPYIAVNIWGVNALGVAVPGSTPYGGNIDGKPDTANHMTKVVMGHLDPSLDSRLSPNGWGFFGDNSFLRGVLQTSNALINEKGVGVYTKVATDYDPSTFNVFGFRKDAVENNPLYTYYQGYWSMSSVKARINVSDTEHIRDASFMLEAQTWATNEAQVTVSAKNMGAPGKTALIDLRSTNLTSNVLLWANSTIQIRSLDATGSHAVNRIETQGDIVPNDDNKYGLGTALLRFKHIYVDQLHAGTISGGEALTGQTWSFGGDMIVDAKAPGITTLYVTNSDAAGAVDLNVERNVTLGGALTAASGVFSTTLAVGGNITLAAGGTVDGVNISSHAADDNIHHARDHALVGPTHTVSELTAGHVLRAIDATSYGFGQISSLAVSNFDEAARDAVGGILTASTTVSWAYVDDGPTDPGSISANVIAGGISHNNLAGLTVGDPHPQYVAVGAARTITVAHIFQPTAPGVPFVLGANAQGQTVIGLRADQLNKQVIAGNGLTGTGTLTSNVTLAVQAAAGGLISVAAGGVSLANGTAQYQVPVTGATPFAPAYTPLSSFAGNGLTFVSAFNIALASPSGLVVTADTLAVDDSIAGAGLTITSKVLAVNADRLLSVVGDAVGIAAAPNTYHFIGSGADTAAEWVSMATLAGAGLVHTNGVLGVGAGTLIAVAENEVSLAAPGGPHAFVGAGADSIPAWYDASILAGGGLIINGLELSVGAGTLIVVSDNSVSHAPAASTWQMVVSLNTTTPAWAPISDLAGAGLYSDVGILHIGSDVTITVGGDAIGVNTAANFIWTGTHGFQSNITTRHILPETVDTYDIGSVTMLYRQSFISQMNAIIFAEKTAQLLGGWFMIPKHAGKMGPVASDQTVIDFGASGAPLAEGAVILVRAHAIDGTPEGAVKAEYMILGANAGGTTWNVTRDVSDANAPDPEWADGTPYMLIGKSGDGRIELSADDTPRISLVTQQTDTYSSGAEIVRIGDLNASFGYSAQTWGITLGRYGVASQSWLTFDLANGIRIGNQATTIGQWAANGNISIGATSSDHILVTPTILQFKSVNTVSASLDGNKWVLGQVANNRSRIELSASGDIDLIYQNGSGNSASMISLSSTGNANFTGSISAADGLIGNWTISPDGLTSTNISLIPGAVNTARIVVGAGANLAGLNSANIATDVAFWAGATHTTRTTAPFIVTAAGALVAKSGLIGNWSISATSIASDATGSPYVKLTPGAANVARIEVGTGVAMGGIHAPSTATVAATGIVFWAGDAWSSRNSADFRVYANGALYATNADITGKITANSGTFTGTVNATDGSFSGTVTATDGKIGGWQIAGLDLYVATRMILRGGGRNTGYIAVGPWEDAVSPFVAGIAAVNATANVAFWAGSSFPDREKSPSAGGPTFKVTAGGALYSVSGTIGGWSITETNLSTTGITLTPGAGNVANITVGNMGGIHSASASGSTASHHIVFWAGGTWANRNAVPFRAYSDGSIVSTKGTIGGWGIGDTAMTSTSGATGISSSGTYAMWVGNATPSNATIRLAHNGNTYFGGESNTFAGKMTISGAATVTGSITAGGGAVTIDATGVNTLPTVISEPITFPSDVNYQNFTAARSYSFKSTTGVLVGGMGALWYDYDGMRYPGAITINLQNSSGNAGYSWVFHYDGGGFSSPGPIYGKGFVAPPGGSPATYTPYRFGGPLNTHGTGMAGSPNAYVGLAIGNGSGGAAWGALFRMDNADSQINLGINNPNNRSPFINFYADGAQPALYSARIIRNSTTNGGLTIYNRGTGSIVFQTDGSTAATITATNNFSIVGTIYSGDGLVNDPAYGFSSDTNTGIWHPAADQLGFATGGAMRITVANSILTSTIVMRSLDGTASSPTYSFSGDTNTGIYTDATGYVTFTGSGMRAVVIGQSGTGATGRAHIGIASRDTGAGGWGPFLSIGRNSNAVVNGSAPGSIQLMARNGSTYHIWTAQDGTLRMDTTANANAPVNSTSETGGQSVGTQSSALAFKDLVGSADPVNQIFAHIAMGAEAVRRFQYKEQIKGADWSRKWRGEEFSGIVVDWAPRYGMDRSDDFPHGKALNVITAIGDLMIGTTSLHDRVRTLEAEVAELKQRLEAANAAE